MRSRIILWVMIFALSVSMVLPALPVQAAQITTRSLTLQEGTGGDGGSLPGGEVDHRFAFTIATTAGIRSIGLQYCTSADINSACTAPTALDVSTGGGTTLAAGSTNLGSSPSWVSTANNVGYVTFGSNPGGAGIVFTLDNAVNTSTEGTFYVWITTYTSTNATTGATDAGTVAASTAEAIILTGRMPETLTFCTGATVPNVGGPGTAPDCSAATSGDIDFPSLFNPTTAVAATSQMAASTNAGSGYVITYQGDTLTSGSNTITAAGGTATAQTVGQSQFGLNLRDNTSPNSGADLYTPGLPGNVYNGAVSANYNTVDQVAFVANTATTVATSANDVSDLETFTVTYIVNVPNSQPAGEYTTTLTYVCTPTF